MSSQYPKPPQTAYQQQGPGAQGSGPSSTYQPSGGYGQQQQQLNQSTQPPGYPGTNNNNPAQSNYPASAYPQQGPVSPAVYNQGYGYGQPYQQGYSQGYPQQYGYGGGPGYYGTQQPVYVQQQQPYGYGNNQQLDSATGCCLAALTACLCCCALDAII